jgi:hypothetical protein
VLPLTTQKAAVLDKVRSLKHWNGGGTINSEGVMWGWRVLSPTAPFTEVPPTTAGPGSTWCSCPTG